MPQPEPIDTLLNDYLDTLGEQAASVDACFPITKSRI